MRWVVLLIVLSGCLASTSVDEASNPIVEAVAPYDASAYLANFDYSVFPDPEATLASVEQFVAAAPQRFDNQYDHDTARDMLEAAYVEAGYNVTRHKFTGPAQTPGMPELEGQNIIATLPGRNESRVLMFGGHYDGAFNGYGAAYDDGLGTWIAVGLARAMAQYEWEHTLVFAAFDQEEAGLVGSRAFAQQFVDQNVTEMTLMMNFDMTGISYPAKLQGVRDQPISALFGGEGQEQFVEWWYAARDHLEYPATATTTGIDLGTGSSDHGAFREHALPAAWVRGALIGGYPGYHNADTVETMIADVGGQRSDLVAGIDGTQQIVFHFALAVDGAFATI